MVHFVQKYGTFLKMIKSEFITNIYYTKYKSLYYLIDQNYQEETYFIKQLFSISYFKNCYNLIIKACSKIMQHPEMFCEKFIKGGKYLLENKLK